MKAVTMTSMRKAMSRMPADREGGAYRKRRLWREEGGERGAVERVELVAPDGREDVVQLDVDGLGADPPPVTTRC